MRSTSTPSPLALRRAKLPAVLLAALCAGLVAEGVQAQEHAHADQQRGHVDRRAGGPVRQREYFDSRYHHDHAYLNRGVFVHALPRNYVGSVFRGRHYFFAGGAWYLPQGAGFVVVAPPLGLFIPVLPPFYTTLWVGGVPYYYADDVYYVYRGPDRGYEVVASPPAPADAPASPPPPPPQSAELFVYPSHGQSPAQEASDKYQCHTWASGETGFDPTALNGAVPPGETEAKHADYDRAMQACLEGRGYTVK